MGLQWQLTGDMLFEATYMGSSSNRLMLTQNINQPAPGPGTLAQVNALQDHRRV